MDRETVTVKGQEILKVIKEIVREGNVRRIIVKHGEKILLDIPVTIAVVGALIAPPLAGLAFVLALFKECTIEVERLKEKKETPKKTASKVQTATKKKPTKKVTPKK